MQYIMQILFGFVFHVIYFYSPNFHETTSWDHFIIVSPAIQIRSWNKFYRIIDGQIASKLCTYA